jgi:uncharacterized membrane protein
MTDPASSTGLSSRTAAALAYGGWWVTGLIIWYVERRDRFARFHAAQATVVFGAIALLIGLFALLAAASLSFMPSAFSVLVGVMIFAWVLGVALWMVSLWKAAHGEEWRIPGAAALADRMMKWRAVYGLQSSVYGGQRTGSIEPVDRSP